MIWFSLGFASGEGLETCPVFSFSKGTVITAGPFLMVYCNQPQLCWWRWLLFCSDAYVLLAWCRSTCLQLQGSYGKTRGRDQTPRSFCPASVLQWIRDPVSRWTSMCTCKHARAHVHPPKHHTSPPQRWKKQKSSLLWWVASLKLCIHSASYLACFGIINLLIHSK